MIPQDNDHPDNGQHLLQGINRDSGGVSLFPGSDPEQHGRNCGRSTLVALSVALVLATGIVILMASSISASAMPVTHLASSENISNIKASAAFGGFAAVAISICAAACLAVVDHYFFHSCRKR